MAASKQQRPRGWQHPVMVAFAAVLVIVAVAAVLANAGVLGGDGVPAEGLTRVLIVAASPDENGDVVGQIIVLADVTEKPAALEAVSPALPVSIPGTTYDTLADAYPFGGGAGVADALARARDEVPHPYVALTAEELADAVDAAGGITVALPADMSVFDGTDLFTFERGEQTLGAAELQAVLKGAPYLADADRERLDASLAQGLAAVLAADQEALTGATRTNLSSDALMRVAASL